MNDAEQFKKEILPFQAAMQRMAESLIGNEEDAADVVQDCFVTLWKERGKLAHVVNKEAWCITLVKRKCVDTMRKRHATVEIDDRMNLVDEEVQEDVRLQIAFDLIDRLPERQARVIRLKHYDDCNTKSIAEAMQISEGNVYTLLSRAYNTLKQMIKEYEKDRRTI